MRTYIAAYKQGTGDWVPWISMHGENPVLATLKARELYEEMYGGCPDWWRVGPDVDLEAYVRRMRAVAVATRNAMKVFRMKQGQPLGFAHHGVFMEVNEFPAVVLHHGPDTVGLTQAQVEALVGRIADFHNTVAYADHTADIGTVADVPFRIAPSVKPNTYCIHFGVPGGEDDE